MRNADCERAIEALDAVSRGAWPASCDESLRMHVAQCGGCADMIEVATTLFADREDALRGASVPASGVVWWRMQLRVRREHARDARRMVIAVQLAVFAAVVVLGLVLLGPGLWNRLPRVDVFASSLLPVVLPWTAPMLLAACAWLALAPVAVWFAVTED